MKLSRILPLVVGGAVAGMVVSGASPAQALSFNFSIINNTGTEAGTINGTIILPDTVGSVTNSASSITIDSAPGALSSLNGLQFIGNSNYNVQVNTFNYDSTTVNTADVIITSVANNFAGSNFLAFRLRKGDSLAPLNFLSASNSDVLANVATGSSLVAPSTIANFATYSTATPVPFDIPGGATIPTVGSLFALGLMRQAKKRLAAKKLVVNPVETV